MVETILGLGALGLIAAFAGAAGGLIVKNAQRRDEQADTVADAVEQNTIEALMREMVAADLLAARKNAGVIRIQLAARRDGVTGIPGHDRQLLAKLAEHEQTAASLEKLFHEGVPEPTRIETANLADVKALDPTLIHDAADVDARS